MSPAQKHYLTSRYGCRVNVSPYTEHLIIVDGADRDRRAAEIISDLPEIGHRVSVRYIDQRTGDVCIVIIESSEEV
jgi:hypothetical protein